MERRYLIQHLVTNFTGWKKLAVFAVCVIVLMTPAVWINETAHNASGEKQDLLYELATAAAIIGFLLWVIVILVLGYYDTWKKWLDKPEENDS